jgi:hypothetical protein
VGPYEQGDWTSREVGAFVGRLVQREFLDGVADICEEQEVQWEWEPTREWLMRKLVITLQGPADRVECAETAIHTWSGRFTTHQTPDGAGGAGG